MISRATSLVVAGSLTWFVSVSVAFAEMWPTLDEYVPKCVLIVQAKAVGDPDEHGMRSFEVIESWKGEFRPSHFAPGMADGQTLKARNGEHGVDVVPGQEIIFFYTLWNQPDTRLARHSTAFPITNGKVVYASTNRILREEMAIEEFRRRIESLAGPTSQPTTAPAKE